MLTCRELSEMVSRAQDRKPSLLERWRMHLHLRVCDGCRNFQGYLFSHPLTLAEFERHLADPSSLLDPLRRTLAVPAT